MNQSTPERKTAPRGIGYSMVYPPGWHEFNTTVEHEDILTKLATAEARSLGRADVVLLIRQKTHQMFEHLRRRGSIGFALPVKQVSGGAMPVSMIMTPLKVGPSGTLMDTVRKTANRNSLETEVVDGADWYLWTTSDQVDEAPELQNNGLNMVVPRPLPDGSVDPDPKAGLWLLYSYAQIEAENGEEFADGLRQLGNAILGTFKWVPVQ